MSSSAVSDQIRLTFPAAGPRAATYAFPLRVPFDPCGFGGCPCPPGLHNLGTDVCVDIDECSDTQYVCDMRTACNNFDGGYNCTACPPGYSGTGRTGCMDVDECASAPCQHGGTCYPRDDSYECACTEGWSGHSCTEWIPCNWYEDSCPDTSVCTSPGPGEINCVCPGGFKFSADGQRCVDVDECAVSPAVEACAATDLDACAMADISSADVETSQQTCEGAGKCVYTAEVTENTVSTNTSSACLPLSFIDEPPVCCPAQFWGHTYARNTTDGALSNSRSKFPNWSTDSSCVAGVVRGDRDFCVRWNSRCNPRHQHWASGLRSNGNVQLHHSDLRSKFNCHLRSVR